MTTLKTYAVWKSWGLEMANYGYIGIPEVHTPESIEPILRSTIEIALDDRWKLERTQHEDEGPVWAVLIPGTAGDTETARKRFQMPGEDIGFPIALQPGQLAFRHGMNSFTRWAQGCMEEALADFFQTHVFYDATNRKVAPGTRDFRCAKTFREYLTRNFKRVSKEDEEWLNRYKRFVPEGFW